MYSCRTGRRPSGASQRRRFLRRYGGHGARVGEPWDPLSLGRGESVSQTPQNVAHSCATCRQGTWEIPKKIVVHPLVLLHAVDHYNRVAKDTKKRVVGILLGEVRQGVIEATAAYALPFEEDERDPSIWFLDHSYHEQMYAMCRKVNVREKLVGWYTTGPKIRAGDLQASHAAALPSPLRRPPGAST